MGAMLASLIINAVGPLLIFVDNKASANGFLMAAVIFGILAYACYLACYKLTTERIVLEENKGQQLYIFFYSSSRIYLQRNTLRYQLLECLDMPSLIR